LIGPVLGLPFSGLSLQGVSCIAEIILVMRYVELRSQLHRMISVLKVREAEISSALHSFRISGKGIVIELFCGDCELGQMNLYCDIDKHELLR
jgi:circadian clock protein KaiC